MCLVSIIMPSYNSSRTIHSSIKSVMTQSFTDWELLITDDCSTDDTCQIIQEFVSRDSRVKLFKNEINSGAGVSRNNSICQANGRFIAFLDSDDMWHSDKLKKQIEFMLENNCALTYTYYVKVNEKNEVTGHIHPPLRVNYNELLKSNVIGCLTAVYDSQVLGKVLMPSIRKRQDMALWLTILQKIPYARCVPEELAIYREGHNSLSSNKIKILLTQWEFYRVYLKMNPIKSAWLFFFYVTKALKKHHL